MLCTLFLKLSLLITTNDCFRVLGLVYRTSFYYQGLTSNEIQAIKSSYICCCVPYFRMPWVCKKYFDQKFMAMFIICGILFYIACNTSSYILISSQVMTFHCFSEETPMSARTLNLQSKVFSLRFCFLRLLSVVCRALPCTAKRWR